MTDFSVIGYPNEKNTLYIVRNTTPSNPYLASQKTFDINVANAVSTLIPTNYLSYYTRTIYGRSSSGITNIINKKDLPNGIAYVLFNGKYIELDSEMSSYEVNENIWNLVRDNFFK